VNGHWFLGSPTPTLCSDAARWTSAGVRSETLRVNGQSFFGSPPASATGERAPAATSAAVPTRIVVVMVMALPPPSPDRPVRSIRMERPARG
jgi:hypothetical protein